jgi:hypothetical protein
MGGPVFKAQPQLSSLVSFAIGQAHPLIYRLTIRCLGRRSCIKYQIVNFESSALTREASSSVNLRVRRNERRGYDLVA